MNHDCATDSHTLRHLVMSALRAYESYEVTSVEDIGMLVEKAAERVGWIYDPCGELNMLRRHVDVEFERRMA